jgi:hypothetical protein
MFDFPKYENKKVLIDKAEAKIADLNKFFNDGFITDDEKYT